jgi:hypothetical protein
MDQWTYKEKLFSSEDIGDYEGFVYMVTDIQNGMKYIGKKNFYSRTKLKPLKGQTRKRTKVVESDWQSYHGSSDEVKSLVEEFGASRFKREILHLCTTKGEMSYMEMKEQIVRDVLLKPDEYYNAFVGGKIHRNHLKKMFTSEVK